MVEHDQTKRRLDAAAKRQSEEEQKMVIEYVKADEAGAAQAMASCQFVTAESSNT